MKLAQSVVFALLLFQAHTFATALDVALPKNWRAPTKTELKDDWRQRSHEKYALVNGDFNGDGVADQARLLVSTRSDTFGLFIFLSQKDGTRRTYKAVVSKNKSILEVMGIDKVAPGQYKTACGKGYWDCKKGETPVITLKYDAINYFKTESANSFFYWNEQSNCFDRIWMSD